jgi:hypothetical protein
MKSRAIVASSAILLLCGLFYTVSKTGIFSSISRLRDDGQTDSSGGNVNPSQNNGQTGEPINSRKKKKGPNKIIAALTAEVLEKYHRNPSSLTEVLDSKEYSSNAILIGRNLIEDGSIAPYELLAAFSTLKDSSDSYRLCEELAEKVCKTDLAMALSFADKLGPGIIRDAVISGISHNMLVADWSKAYAYVAKSGFKEDYSKLNSSIQSRVKEATDTQLSNYFTSKDFPPEISNLFAREYGKRIFNENDVNGSLSLIGNMPENVRDSIKHGIFSAATKSEKQEKWIVDYLSNDTTWDNFTKAQYTITMAINKMSSSSPKEVMEWSLSIANKDLAEGTAQGAFQSWMQRDSIKASEWAVSLPSGSGKDAVVTTLIANLVELGDQASAEKWLPQISSTSAQDNAKKILKRR